jgi:hypothetical protein
MVSPQLNNVGVQVLGRQFLGAARSSLSVTSAGASQELQQLAQDAAEPLLGLGVLSTSSAWTHTPGFLHIFKQLPVLCAWRYLRGRQT